MPLVCHVKLAIESNTVHSLNSRHFGTQASVLYSDDLCSHLQLNQIFYFIVNNVLKENLCNYC